MAWVTAIFNLSTSVKDRKERNVLASTCIEDAKVSEMETSNSYFYSYDVDYSVTLEGNACVENTRKSNKIVPQTKQKS
jgi:hypothetical protein